MTAIALALTYIWWYLYHGTIEVGYNNYLYDWDYVGRGLQFLWSFLTVFLTYYCFVLICIMFRFLANRDPVKDFVQCCKNGEEEKALAHAKNLPATGLIVDKKLGKVFPLHLACEYGLPKLAKTLLDMRDCKPLTSTLEPKRKLWANCKNPKPDGENHEVSSLVYFVDDAGNMPLHIACTWQDKQAACELVFLLVDQFQAPTGATNFSNLTPLEIAAKYPDNHVYEWLSQHQMSKTHLLVNKAETLFAMGNYDDALHTFLEAQKCCHDKRVSSEVRSRVDACHLEITKAKKIWSARVRLLLAALLIFTIVAFFVHVFCWEYRAWKRIEHDRRVHERMKRDEHDHSPSPSDMSFNACNFLEGFCWM